MMWGVHFDLALFSSGTVQKRRVFTIHSNRWPHAWWHDFFPLGVFFLSWFLCVFFTKTDRTWHDRFGPVWSFLKWPVWLSPTGTNMGGDEGGKRQPLTDVGLF